MADEDDLILSELDDEELVAQMFDDLYDGLRDEIMEELEILDKRVEEIESRLKGAHDRIDGIADMVRPIEQLVPLITKDFYNRFREVEEKVKHL